jgi:hypothetical protein
MFGRPGDGGYGSAPQHGFRGRSVVRSAPLWERETLRASAGRECPTFECERYDRSHRLFHLDTLTGAQQAVRCPSSLNSATYDHLVALLKSMKGNGDGQQTPFLSAAGLCGAQTVGAVHHLCGRSGRESFSTPEILPRSTGRASDLRRLS